MDRCVAGRRSGGTGHTQELTNDNKCPAAPALAHKQCGDNLTRANLMKLASHLDMELPRLLPDIRLKTTPSDLRPIKQLRLVRFDGER
jgi:hypothetical protein